MAHTLASHWLILKFPGISLADFAMILGDVRASARATLQLQPNCVQRATNARVCNHGNLLLSRELNMVTHRYLGTINVTMVTYH